MLAEVRELRVARQVAAQVAREPAAPAASRAPAARRPASTSRRSASSARSSASTTSSRRPSGIGSRSQTDRPFVERLVHFWSNHFAVSADKQPLAALAGLYEQEAIRPHVDRQLLRPAAGGGAASRDDPLSRQPDVDGRRARRPRRSCAATAAASSGSNENLAREIFELHTLGVDGGYTQADVTEFAKVLTGWSIGGALGEGGRGRWRASAATPGGPGEFHFRALMHEPGDKTVLGKRYRERGVEEGEDVLRDARAAPAHRAPSRDEARAAFRRRRSAAEARRALGRRLSARTTASSRASIAR